MWLASFVSRFFIAGIKHIIMTAAFVDFIYRLDSGIFGKQYAHIVIILKFQFRGIQLIVTKSTIDRMIHIKYDWHQHDWFVNAEGKRKNQSNFSTEEFISMAITYLCAKYSATCVSISPRNGEIKKADNTYSIHAYSPKHRTPLDYPCTASSCTILTHLLEITDKSRFRLCLRLHEQFLKDEFFFITTGRCATYTQTKAKYKHNLLHKSYAHGHKNRIEF